MEYLNILKWIQNLIIAIKMDILKEQQERIKK